MNAPAASILVIDDEPDLRTLYELTLLREGATAWKPHPPCRKHANNSRAASLMW